MSPLNPLPVEPKTLPEFISYAETFGISGEDAIGHYQHMQHDQVFANDRYLVIIRNIPAELNPTEISGIKWLSIRRVDGETVRDWADLQEIKNQLLGPEAEAVEVFPAESRKIDAVNQYHLFGGAWFKAPFGFPREYPC